MHSSTRKLASKLLVSAAAVTLLVGASACGGDDDDAVSTQAPAATEAAAETTHAPDHTDAGGATDVAAFCDAEIAAEQAANMSDDIADAQPAFDALVAAAPADIEDSVQSVIDNAAAGPGDPAFD